MSEFSYMKLFPADLIADTTHLTASEFGAYVRLLCGLWLHRGRLPNNDLTLQRTAGLQGRNWARAWLAIKSLFRFSDDGNHIGHKRIDEEIENARQRTGKGKQESAAEGSESVTLSQTQNPRNPLENNKVAPTARARLQNPDSKEEKERREGRGDRDRPPAPPERQRDLGDGFKTLSSILASTLAGPTPAATYSDREIATLARMYPNVPDMGDRVQKLVAWAGGQGVRQPNEIKRIVARALAKRAEPQQEVA